MLNQNRKKKFTLAASVAAVAVMAVLPFLSSVYTTHVISVAMISYLCVLSVYVLLGLCGQNSFAQAGLWGVGAYLAGNNHCIRDFAIGHKISDTMIAT